MWDSRKKKFFWPRWPLRSLRSHNNKNPGGPIYLTQNGSYGRPRIFWYQTVRYVGGQKYYMGGEIFPTCWPALLQKAMGEGQGRQIYHNGSGTKKKRLVVTFIIRKLISFLKRCFPSGEITRSSQSFFGHDAMMTPNQGQELDAIFFRLFNACNFYFQFHFQ